jgi:excisionase family DNA binding protein
MFERMLLRPSEVAVAIGVGRSKIYDLIHSGEIPSIRIGGSIRVPADQLREVIALRTLTPKAPQPVELGAAK